MGKQKGLSAIALRRRLQAGQILLIVVLVVIVASTVGLSIASRSITSLRTSTEEAESQKALAAAEAGIERAIQSNTPIALSNINVTDSKGNKNSTYSTTVTSVNSTEFLVNGGNVISKDEGVDVWFVNHDPVTGNPDYATAVTFNGFLHLFWGLSSDSCNEAAIQAVVITRNPLLLDTDPNKIKSYRYVYDGCSSRRTGTGGNNFTEADFVSRSMSGVTLNMRTKANDLTSGISSDDKIILVRVIPIYKDAVIGVYACNSGGGNCTSLPSQGYKITSTGTSGQANRKITVFKGYPQAYLPYLSYGLFVAN